jgi:cholesterol oxidase
VLLAHGIASSADTFTIDTIDTNLVEYLSANGYDVWVLDWRGSIDLATAGDQNLDDVARHDLPAAIDQMKTVTGATDVQVVAHDVAGLALLMALLEGMSGVRSCVVSQAATHLPGVEVASELDIETLYEDQRLNRQTRGALPELLGSPHPSLVRHLATAAKAGHLVTADGEDTYVGHLERLALPITFVHGSENRLIRPEAMDMTVAALCEMNDDAFYKKHLMKGYGNTDCMFGADAAADVYPVILGHLEETNLGTES